MPDRGFDIVIQGAGLQALETAVSLAKARRKVLVAEQSPKPGGRNVAFRRGQYEFETGLPGHEEGELCYADAVAMDFRLRELGSEVWYDRAITKTDENSVTLSDGAVVPCGDIITDFTPDAELIGRTFTVFLGLDVPAEALGVKHEPSGEIHDLELPGNARGGGCVLQLTKYLPRGAFDAVTEADYFRWKDRTAREIVETFEKETGADLRSHIEEIDAATPATWARKLLPPDHPGRARRLANALHPPIQHVVVAEITEREFAKSYRLVPDKEKGTEKLAVFRAGQYITLKLSVDGRTIWKPYSIQSGPGDVLAEDGGSYTVTIRRALGGLGSGYVLDHWQVGTRVDISAPMGDFYYSPLRDSRQVLALAGGSGITPYFSLVSAIADGIEDFSMTILYGSRTASGILLREELEELAERCQGKVKIVHVISDEEPEGYEHGLISREILKKYAPAGDTTVYLSGGGDFREYAEKEAAVLRLPRRRLRHEMFGEVKDGRSMPDWPGDIKEGDFAVTVLGEDRTWSLRCRAGQSLMDAMERGGVGASFRCRSGECGWCRTKLVSGEVYVVPASDGRPKGDPDNGWIHPCGTFPLGDVTLELPRRE